MFKRLLPLLAVCAAVMLASCSSFYGNLVNNEVQRLQDLTKELSLVNDRASADAMAPRISEYGSAFGEAFQGITVNGKPSWLEMYRIKTQLEKDSTRSSATEFMGQIIRLNTKQFYGSQALKDAIWNQSMAAMKVTGY